MISVFVWGVLRSWPRWLSAEIVKRNVRDYLIITPLRAFEVVIFRGMRSVW